MKLSKLFVGLAAALVLSACGPTAPAEHTITFNYNYNYGEVVEGEPAPTTIKVRDGQTVSAEDIPTPTRTDGEWAFKRWCTTAACTNAFDWTKAIEKDYTVYADWVDLTNCDILTLVGSFGAEGTTEYWNPNSDTYKLATTDGIHYSIEEVVITEGVEFQVIKNHAWDGQMNVTAVDDATDKSIYSGTGNIVISQSAYYTITVDLSASKPVHIEKVREYEDPNKAVSYNVYLVGDAFTGAAWGVNDAGKMEGPAALTGTWTKTITLNDAGQLKVIVKGVNSQGVEGDLTTWVGMDKLPTVPTGWEAGDGGNIIVAGGTYTITYTITAAAGDGVIAVTAA